MAVPGMMPETRSEAGRPRTDAAPGAPPALETRVEKKTIAITSPMVGTYYRAPAPDADPYVEMGDMVEVGQTVCIVEAMKLMNEIESEVRGRIVQILVENAHPVEFGQTLFLLEPA
jgi:acetyl-CoA carboxylase biotin carboxyl carrier protein